MNRDVAVAYHEAGHAVLAWLYCVPFDYVQVDLGVGTGSISHPKTEYRSAAAVKIALNRSAYSAAGGPLAESLYYNLIGEPHHESLLWSREDFEALGDFNGGPSSYSPESHPVTWVVKEVLVRAEVRMAIAVLAGRLLATGHVTYDEASLLIAAHITKKGKLPSATAWIRGQRDSERFCRRMSTPPARQAA